MSTLQHLLLVAPPSMSHTPAFDRAQALAKATHASLYIVAFVYVDTLEILGLIDADVRDRAREGYLRMHRDWLNVEAQCMRDEGVEVTTEVIWVKKPLDKISKYVRSFNIDMVIKDVHRESALKRVFFTPLDWQLLRECEVPVHLVTDTRNPLPRKILATIDVTRDDDRVSELNERIIQNAMGVASQCHAALHVLSIYDWSSVYGPDVVVGKEPVLISPSYDKYKQIFEAVAKKHGMDHDHRHFIVGTPVKTIAEYAHTNNYDIIVMGTVGHRTFNKLLGSTAENILYRPPCSIMVIKPAELADNKKFNELSDDLPDVHDYPF
jgi:universal stress protein E